VLLACPKAANNTLGPIGFGISATYFLVDAATDGFGGYGDPLLTPNNVK
jgi:hypothetical protein